MVSTSTYLRGEGLKRSVLLPTIGAASLAIALVVLLFGGATTLSIAYDVQVHGRSGWGRLWSPWNATIETTDVTISGVITDAQGSLIVITSGGETYNLKVPALLDPNGRIMSLSKVFFEDLIKKNDRLEVSATKVTITRSDGSSYTFYVLKSLRDLDTGFDASVPNFPFYLRGSTRTTQAGQSL